MARMKDDDAAPRSSAAAARGLRADAETPTAPPHDLEEFVAENRDRLLGTLTLYCHDPELASELVQESLVKLCRDWERVQQLDYPTRWLLRVAINLANSRSRRAAAERRAFVKHGLSDAISDETATLAERDEVRFALTSLRRRRREALVLRFYLDWSLEEVAAHMHCSRNAASSLTSRALDDLRTALGRDVADV